MDSLNVEKYLDIVNKEREVRELKDFIPLYPMLRVENKKLYIGTMLVKADDNVWSSTEQIKPKYWVLIDINNDKIVEFNKTNNKDFVIGNMIPKNVDNKQKEMSKYTVEKTLQYKNYLINDIKNEQLPIQKKLANILGYNMEVDGEIVNINDYLLSNLEKEIKSKIDDLVNVLIQSKYVSITIYYDNLFNQIIKNYKSYNNIDYEKMKLCIEIMNNYYDGIVGIDNFFNIQ